jgi:hypothetical protein
MEIGDKPKGEIGWWPYVGTFIAGAIGFSLVANPHTPKVLELNAEGHKYVDCDFCSEKKPLGQMRRMPFDPETQSRVRYSGYYSTYACCDDCYRERFKGKPVGKSVLRAEGPTDDELESWSERQDDGSMLVMIDEDGDSHTELTYDKEGDLTDLKRFMAEVYEAEKKHRRRTTFSWTRGIEPGFGDESGVIDHSKEYAPSGYLPYSNSRMANESKAYYIDNLPDGYHLHLWKPRTKKGYWTMYLKSPETEWKRMTQNKKKMMKALALNWYNTAIAKPDEYSLTPIEQMMITQGMKLDTGLITRSEIENADGKGATKIIYYYSPPNTEPQPFGTVNDTRSSQVHYTGTFPLPKELRNFWRGMKYLGVKKAGSVRSVNRYNRNRQQWVQSQPSWFRNLCKQGINWLEIIAPELHRKTEPYTINTIPFMKFNGPSITFDEITKTPLRGDIPQFEVRQSDGEWLKPRIGTQKKMLENAQNSVSEKFPGTGDVETTKAAIVEQCVKKYQPQTYPYIYPSFTQKSLQEVKRGFTISGHIHQAKTFYLEQAGQYMARRFKKN